MYLRQFLLILSINNAVLTCYSSDSKIVHKRSSSQGAHFLKTNKEKEHGYLILSRRKLHSSTPSITNLTSGRSSLYISNNSTIDNLNNEECTDHVVSVSSHTGNKQTHLEGFSDKSDCISALYRNFMDSIYSYLSHNKTDREKRNKVKSAGITVAKDDNFSSVLNGAAGFLTFLIDDLGKAYPVVSENPLVSKDQAHLKNPKQLSDRRQSNSFKARPTSSTIKSYEDIEHYADESIDEDSCAVEVSTSNLFNDEEQDSPEVKNNYFGAKNIYSSDELLPGQLKEPHPARYPTINDRDIKSNKTWQAPRKPSQTTVDKSDEHIIQLVDQEIFKVLEVLKAGLNSESIMNKVKSSRNNLNNPKDQVVSTGGTSDEVNRFLPNRRPMMAQDADRKESLSDFEFARNYQKLPDRFKSPSSRKNYNKSFFKNLSKSIPDMKGPLMGREKSDYFWQLYKPECRLKNKVKNQFHFPNQKNIGGHPARIYNSLNEENVISQNKSKQCFVQPMGETSKNLTVTSCQMLQVNYSTEKSGFNKSNADLEGQKMKTTASQLVNTPNESCLEFVTLVIPASDIKELLSNQIENQKLTTEGASKTTRKFFYFKRRDSKSKPPTNLSKTVMLSKNDANHIDTDYDAIELYKKDQYIPLDNSEFYILPSDDFIYELNDRLLKLPNTNKGSRERIEFEPNVDYEFINGVPPKMEKLTKKSFLDYDNNDYSLIRKQMPNNGFSKNYGIAEDGSKDGLSYINSDVLTQKERNDKYRRNNVYVNYKNKHPRYIGSRGHYHSRFRGI